MPSKKFALDAGGPERLEATWEGAFKSLAISVDGTSVASFATAEELETPRRAPLSDGGELEVSIAKYGFLPELRLSRDGVAIPGSSGDPATQLAAATNVLYAIALLNAIIGVVAGALGIKALQDLGIGWSTLFAAAIYGGLGWLVSKRSAAALWAAMALFVLDGVFTIVFAARAGASPPIGGIIMRIFFLMPMFRGIGAIRGLNAPPRPKPRRPKPAASASAAPAGVARGSAPPVAAPAPAPGPAASASAAKVLSGEAEKKRLALTERPDAASAIVRGRRVEAKGPPGVDAARKSLRFIAHKVEIVDDGLRVTDADGGVRDIPFASVARVFARQLPPDPPWDAAMFVDVAPASGTPVRVFGTTTVNYAALGGGSTSRLENTRKLVSFLRDRCVSAVLDEPTREFALGPKVPMKFANMTQFLEYDGAFDAPRRLS